MSRKLQSNIPSTRESREPTIPDRHEVEEKDKKQKSNQKCNYDHHHGSRELPDLEQGDMVWISNIQEQAQVQKKVAPRSYEVETDNNVVYRRNRRDLVTMPSPRDNETTETNTEPVIPPLIRSTHSTTKPDRWDPSYK
uniref:Uncharacterized protein n=1 Tax=Amphimedon queenslandica TaxID=400682 RepID=A0A1X7VWU4_AMPQE